jgi:anti-sigma factor RsiW
MRDYEIHLSDEELLLAVDGELSGSRAKHAEEHLADCWDCRARKQSLEKTISNLVEARHAEFDSQVSVDAGRRALLKANLAQVAAQPPVEPRATRGGDRIRDGGSDSDHRWRSGTHSNSEFGGLRGRTARTAADFDSGSGADG